MQTNGHIPCRDYFVNNVHAFIKCVFVSMSFLLSTMCCRIKVESHCSNVICDHVPYTFYLFENGFAHNKSFGS
jgi:hypothetical protein